MKHKRNFWAADTMLLVLGAVCLALAVMLAIARPAYLIPVAVVLLVVLVFAFVCLQRLRSSLRKLMGGHLGGEGSTVSGLSALSVPLVAVSNRLVVWYNDAFLQQVAGGAECALQPLEGLVPGLDYRQAALPEGQDVQLGKLRFTVHGNPLLADRSVFFVVFVEDTLLKHRSDEYLKSRPAVLHFVIDTYDEVLKEMRESERALVVSNIDAALERFVAKSSGFLRRVSASRYLAVVEERHLAEMMNGRFSILDEVRRVDEDTATVTLSIGVGRMGATLRECEDMAQQALDMALGRGGDQAAVKSPDGYEFYGGVTRSVEKRTKVRSRITATAIRELIQQYDRVLVMGHKNSDMDSVGAAVGMLRFCRICKKPAAVVIDQEASLAKSLLELLLQEGCGDDLLPPQQAQALAGPKTLCIIVDTHVPYLLESEAIYRACGGTVIIDHHRRVVGHIEDALLFYHEPYASSASELVAELLQYLGDGKDDKPTPVEAEAMLAGIMLDTRTFSMNVGVRTFEAAAWLRRVGAQTVTVKRLFRTTMNEYLYRSHLVSEAKIHEGCAVALSDRVPLECEVVAPQAANELLGIDGVSASIVGVLLGDEVRISARSMGDVNMQLIMEKLGGGGHHSMAGAQLKNIGLDQARQMIYEAISAYKAERTHTD